MPDMSVTLKNMRLKSPVILASGILGVTGELLINVANAGAGAVTTKTIFLEQRDGNTSPVVAEYEHGLLNCIGLPCPGIEESAKEIRIAKAANILLIASVGGKDTDEFIKVAQCCEDAGADALELNFSCPHAEAGLGANIQYNRELARSVVGAVKKNVSVPVIIKLTAEFKIAEIAKIVEAAGADMITCSNSVGPGMLIDVHTGRPVLSNKEGGVSGPAIKPIALRAVYQIAKNTTLPIIGTGGIYSGKDALEFIMAGATAVGVGTSIMHHDLEAFKKINSEIQKYLEDSGHKNLEEIRGIALK
ncbi:MAG: dihydroorotate dehydrogenase [Nanoarchaeota archaeon]|nr:dihydroorotate dehydrogenase [Nanoarchaeota archaeon]MBU4300731.1 dihydroorotate dehydrogenase [Nanoarchaeota archaeon]MBU4452401.1 dihydroorotate dehydrogenase [Nanoarchaeota archaeon]MCG2723323.1 dihydroorotate dehydrogenase [archaeon]